RRNAATGHPGRPRARRPEPSPFRRAGARAGSTCRRRPSRRRRDGGASSPPPSEIALALLALHGGGAVAVDEATLALGSAAEVHLLDKGVERRRAALDRAGQGIAAQRTES